MTTKTALRLLTLAALAVTGLAQAQAPITSGLVVHLDAGSGVTLGGGTGYAGLPRVSAWSDQAALGGANDAAQITSQRQPVLDPAVAGLNNQPALYFEGSVDGDALVDYLDIAGVGSSFTSAATLFIVAQVDPSRESPVMYTLYATSSADNWWQFSGGSGYTSTFRTPRFNGDLPPGGAPQSGAHIFEIVSAADYFWTEDGVLIKKGSETTTPGTVFNSGANHRIAQATINNSDSKAFPGWVAEVLVYDRELSETERNIVGYYLQQKYDIASAYPPACITCADYLQVVIDLVCSESFDTFAAWSSLVANTALDTVTGAVCAAAEPGSGGEAACEAYIQSVLTDGALGGAISGLLAP